MVKVTRELNVHIKTAQGLKGLAFFLRVMNAMKSDTVKTVNEFKLNFFLLLCRFLSYSWNIYNFINDPLSLFTLVIKLSFMTHIHL